jgi:hypothetical protein
VVERHDQHAFCNSKRKRLRTHVHMHLCCFAGKGRNWSSSVSIVSDYGLDDRAVEVRSPVEANDFSSSLCVQTDSGAHPASCTVGTGRSFPGGTVVPGRDADHSPPSSADVNE